LLLYRKNHPLRENAALVTTAGTTRSPRTRPNRYAAAAPSTKAPTIERSHVSGVGCKLTASRSGSKTALCMLAARGAPAAWYGFQSGISPSR
jgi:hypothetical protein